MYDGILTLTQMLTCAGFDDPFAAPLVLAQKTKDAIPLQIALSDSNGGVITDTDISSPPMVNVMSTGVALGEVPPDPNDFPSKGQANKDNIFEFDGSIDKWVYNLDIELYVAPGKYTINPVAGDNSYTIDTSTGCLQTFERLN
jgi:hypothetical protein